MTPWPDNFSFISSGDPEEDRREAERIRRSQAAEAEGLCPNGDGAMRLCTDPKLEGLFECVTCGCVTNYDPMARKRARDE
jgi:hypothetical protein